MAIQKLYLTSRTRDAAQAMIIHVQLPRYHLSTAADHGRVTFSVKLTGEDADDIEVAMTVVGQDGKTKRAATWLFTPDQLGLLPGQLKILEPVAE
jgi:hypothetical protein